MKSGVSSAGASDLGKPGYISCRLQRETKCRSPVDLTLSPDTTAMAINTPVYGTQTNAKAGKFLV